MALSFSQVDCRNCGAPRIAGIPCPDCGGKAAPHEADSNRQIRQRRSSQAQILLERPNTGIGTPSVDELSVWDATARCLQALVDALPLASDPEPCYADVLVQPIRSFLELETAVVASARLRPWVYLWQQADQTIRLIRDTFTHSLCALGADTPLEAQTQAGYVQENLDSAARELEEFSERAGLACLLNDAETPTEALGALFAAAYQRSGAQTILALDAAGRDLYARNVGTATPPAPRGLGISILIADLEAEVLLDKERMWRLIRTVGAYIGARSEAFVSFAANDPWKDSFKRALQHLSDAVAEHRHLLSQNPPPRIAARSVINLAQDLGEAATPMLASLVTLKGSSSYEARRTSDSSDLLRILADRGHDEIYAGLEPSLRNARAHLDFEISGEHVTLFPNGEGHEEVAVDELVDKVLMGYETVLAIQTALSVAAYTFTDLEEGELDPVGFLDIPLESRAWLVMDAVGCSPRSVVRDAATLRINVSSQVTGSSLAWAAGLVPYLPSDVVSIALEDPEGNKLSGPVGPVRSWSDCGEGSLEQDIFLWRAQHEWTINGVRVMGKKYLRKMVAMAAADAQREPYGEKVRRLKLLRSLCQEYGDAEMGDSITAAIRIGRLLVMGGGAQQADFDRLELLLYYESVRLPVNPNL